MRLGETVKGEEVVVFEGNYWDNNVVTIIADISDDKMYTIKLYGTDSKVTLEDIREMCETEGYEEGIITVIVENPLEGVVYQYGNYANDMWYIHGTTQGYA